MITDIEYCAADRKAYGTESGERVEVVYNGSDFVLHPSVAWARAEQALLQEQRDAQIAKEKEARLNDLIDVTLAVHIPYRICSQLPGWPGTVVVRNDIVYLLRKEGYL